MEHGVRSALQWRPNHGAAKPASASHRRFLLSASVPQQLWSCCSERDQTVGLTDLVLLCRLLVPVKRFFVACACQHLYRRLGIKSIPMQILHPGFCSDRIQMQERLAYMTVTGLEGGFKMHRRMRRHTSWYLSCELATCHPGSKTIVQTYCSCHRI